MAAASLRAQQPPTPDQARRLLESRPDFEAQLRREIANSGLTPDQIRARLRAAGYPEDLLDTYLMSRSPRDAGGGGGAKALPSDDVLDAIAALGITDSVDTSQLREALRRRRLLAAGRDSLRFGRDIPYSRDSLGVLDSLSLLDSLVEQRMTADSLGRLVIGGGPGRGARPSGRRAQTDSGFSIYGLNVFAGATTQFDPNLSGPVDANYRLGPGDRLVLLITGDSERAYTLDVTREGFIVVPNVGELPVANLTLGQLEDVLYPRLGRVFSGLRRGDGATTHFSVTVARLHSNQVFVLGDVEQPGSYRVSSAGTALTALYAAGGPSANGSMRRIEIRRGGRLVDSLDLYDYLLRADGSHDPRLHTGDVVFVTVHGPRVRIYGEVVRPATYELRQDETLADVLRAAGGFTAEATRRRVQIARILPPSQRDTTDRARVVLDVSADQVARGKDLAGLAVRLEAGDVIRVFPVSDRVGRRVTVRGSVWTPSAVGFTPGMRLSDAIRMAGGIKPDAYLGQLLVSRLRGSDSIRVQLRTAFQDSTGRMVDDMPLAEDDEIRVFSVTELRPPAFVAITGAVRRAGRYPYREAMTLRDLVLVAGGLDGRAYLGDAEIARLPQSHDQGRLAVAQRVPLDSSYLLMSAGKPAGGVAQAGGTRDVALQPYDNVLVFAQPDWEAPRRVVLTGEVRRPGTYTLVSKSETLNDVLRRAGGPTGSAYPDGMVFYRRRGRVGRVVVDAAQVLRDSTAHDNLLLQDGDSIHVPPYSGVVEVQGEVNAPRAVAYEPGADLAYYIRAAGGAGRKGDASHAYVTQPDGRVEPTITRRWWPDAGRVPRPGSVVYVPEREVVERSDTIARLGVLAQIIGGLVALVAITRRQ